jgi:hypothetical protein
VSSQKKPAAQSESLKHWLLPPNGTPKLVHAENVPWFSAEPMIAIVLMTEESEGSSVERSTVTYTVVGSFRPRI